MEIFLRKTMDSDIYKIEQWIADIEANKYMSRFYPKVFDGVITDMGLYLWFMIMLEDSEVGTIWLEKDQLDADEATLGILIGVKDKLGHGIGRIAIQKIIAIAMDEWQLKTIRLHVRKNNPRAVKCYESCNFVIVGVGTKTNDDGQSIAFLEMKSDLAEFLSS